MDVRLPNLGEGADSGVVVSIQVKPGDMVEKGQTLIELESGKAVVPIPSPAAGKVAALKVKEGDKISTGAPLLVLEGAVGGEGASGGGVSGAAAGAAAAGAGAKKPAKVRSAAPVARVEVVEEEVEELEEDDTEADLDEQGEPVPASPEVRRVARLLGIPLRKIQGSERGGRIVWDDLKAYVARLRRLASQPRGGGGGGAVRSAAPAAPVVERVDFSQFGEITKKPLTPLRKVISQRMLQSTTTVPQVTQFDDADITGLMELRKKYVAAYEAKGARLTVTGLVLKAIVDTLKKHPVFNASIDDVAGEVVYKEYIHLGIAVDTEVGLMVPVIRDAHKKSVLQLSLDLATLAEKARDRKITGDEMRGGSFTISNQGGIGGGHFTPIVNLPEVAILGMGKGALKAVVKDKQIVQRMMLPLALSYDHRLIDGGSAARFITDLVAAVEGFGEADVKL